MHLYNLCFAVLAVVMESFKSVPSFNLPCPRLYFYFQLLISNAQFLKSAQLNMFASYSAQYRLTSNSWQYLINDVLLFVLFSLQPYCSEQPKHFLLAISTHLAINSVCGRHCTFVMASPTQKWKKTNQNTLVEFTHWSPISCNVARWRFYEMAWAQFNLCVFV